MRLATIKSSAGEEAAIITAGGALPLSSLNRRTGSVWPTDLFGLIESGQLPALTNRYRDGGADPLAACTADLLPLAEVQFGPLYRRPRKIWGIGLNYREHAGDLHAQAPTSSPASFMKPDTAIIGSGETIEIPRMSDRTTAEAELGVIIGRRCREVSAAEAAAVIAGFTTIIDMTAEDILQQNPRYLTQSKSFDTFFSFGPLFLTPDEIPDLLELEVATVSNGRIHRQNRVANMTFPPLELVAYHSRIMTLLPGDIISTGTPGAVVIADGDVVECRIAGFPPLVNPVVDLKLQRPRS